MLRMEIALFIVVAFLAYNYFSAEGRHTKLHKIFSLLLTVVMSYLLLDAATVYTVNHLDTVPRLLNDILHRFYIAAMLLSMHLFYRYIATLVHKETGHSKRLEWAAKVFLAVVLLVAFTAPVHYAQTSDGNYADGIQANICYFGAVFYFIVSADLLIRNRKQLKPKEISAIGMALIIELVVCILQWLNHAWLISGMGLTLMTLAFYITLENPEILRTELAEQEFSMLYLKSQINPHFLYNTLDTIRIQAQLSDDNEVAALIMRLVDFFRLSVKIDSPMVTLDDELELLDAYMDLMCARYPQLICKYDIDPSIGEVEVPNFILQPIVENSLLHGLKNKGYCGSITISAHKTEANDIEISVCDTGGGFSGVKKAEIDEMLRNYAKEEDATKSCSIGILNVQKRIKLLCGPKYGLTYTENETEGITAHLLLSLKEKKV